MSLTVDYSQNRQLFKLNVCRLCSLIRDKLLPIFDSSGSKVDLKIKECFPNLDIKKGDSKPQQICIDCITKLNMFNEFLQVCVESEYKFDSYVKQLQEQETLLRSSSLNNKLSNGSWPDESSKIQKNNAIQNDEGVIVLSKLDPVLCDPSVRDFVVMVELKYKENKSSEITTCNDSNRPTVEQRLDLGSQDQVKSFPINYHNTSTYSENSQTKEYSQNKAVSPIKSTKEKKNFHCAVCGQSFSRRTRLNSHMSRHTLIKPFKCDRCDKSYGTRWDLSAHKHVHSMTFVCHSCNKSFGTKFKLVRHSRIHTGERPFTCPNCGKSFGEKRNLDNHVRAHTGDKPYLCTTCGKTFAVRSHLKDHLSVHSKTLRFTCTLCGKSFKWKTNYNRHLKSHTVMNNPK